MKALKLFIFFLCIALPLTIFAAGQDGLKKAETLDELAMRYDSTPCKECHSEIWEQWQQSLHAKSMFGPLNSGRTAATIKTTVENGLKDWPFSGVKKPQDVKIEHLMICAKCHLPQLIEADESVAQELVRNIYAFADTQDEKAAATLQKVNIGCLICHQRNAIIHKWKFGTPEKNAVYGSKDGEHPAPGFPSLKKSPYMKYSILCGQCHGQGPNFDLTEPTQCATLYASYLMAYVPESPNPKNCQECHMENSQLGHNMQSYRSPEMAKMAVDFKAEAYAFIWRDVATTTPMAQVTVEMKNNAGHGIPDG